MYLPVLRWDLGYEMEKFLVHRIPWKREGFAPHIDFVAFNVGIVIVDFNFLFVIGGDVWVFMVGRKLEELSDSFQYSVA